MSGWAAYKKIADGFEKNPSNIGETVEYTCEISVTFEPYRQALLNSSNKGKQSNLESKMFSGNAKRWNASRIIDAADSASSDIGAMRKKLDRMTT